MESVRDHSDRGCLRVFRLQSVHPTVRQDRSFRQVKLRAARVIFLVTAVLCRKKIKLDVRKDHTGQWQVFDIVRKRFLPTVSPREGFERFLDWLESISQGVSVYMVSHGNADILILDRSGLANISYKYFNLFGPMQEPR